MNQNNLQNKILGIKIFTIEDQELFASMSLDRNPMHMDSIAARRLITGSLVVHGIHILLWAIDYFIKEGSAKSKIYRIKCEFKQPVNVDEEVTFLFQETGNSIIKIFALVDNIMCVRTTLYLANDKPVLDFLIPEPKCIDEKVDLDLLDEPLNLEVPDLLNFSATISNHINKELDKAFQSLKVIMQPRHVLAISRLSYIVGMLCPGLHSMFASLDISLEFNRKVKGYTSFAVNGFDQRFNLFEIALFDGDVTGMIKAFRRPAPFKQSSISLITDQVKNNEFEKTTSLIIGGSRGLGELTAKIICAGSGNVFLGYSSGHRDAHDVTFEITKSRLGTCRPVQLNVLDKFTNEVREFFKKIDYMFYFATPHIAIKKKKSIHFNSEIFGKFIEYYVNKFYDLCCEIETVTHKNVTVFVPSSVFIDERPQGMTEYSMAKIAAEVLAQDINRFFSKVQVVCCRLPRLGSDQTNSIMEVERKNNIDILLPLIRKIYAQKHSFTNYRNA